MKKSEFLKNGQVQEFIEYLAGKWDGGEPIFFLGNNSGYANIKHAFEKYKWTYNISMEEIPLKANKKGSTFKESNEALGELQQIIRASHKAKDENLLFSSSKAILRWGGPRVFGSNIKGNYKFLVENKGHLYEYFSSVKDTWAGLNNNTLLLGNKIEFRSNSGFTKIQSLLLNDFIIYDSRVGATIINFLNQKFAKNIPELLRVDLPNGTKSKYVLDSNPGVFKSTYQKDEKHFYSNVKTSWILKEIVDLINSSSKKAPITIRTLESALFMIGGVKISK